MSSKLLRIAAVCLILTAPLLYVVPQYVVPQFQKASQYEPRAGFTLSEANELQRTLYEQLAEEHKERFKQTEVSNNPTGGLIYRFPETIDGVTHWRSTTQRPAWIARHNRTWQLTAWDEYRLSVLGQDKPPVAWPLSALFVYEYFDVFLFVILFTFCAGYIVTTLSGFPVPKDGKTMTVHREHVKVAIAFTAFFSAICVMPTDGSMGLTYLAMRYALTFGMVLGTYFIASVIGFIFVMLASNFWHATGEKLLIEKPS